MQTVHWTPVSTPGKPNLLSATMSLAVQVNGKILIAPASRILHTPNHVRRLNADGSLDSSVCAVADDFVSAVALQADGRILAGGAFSNVAGQPRERLVRLVNSEPATESLSYTGTTITWLRGGSSPEVWRASFESSMNGMDWADLGAGHYIGTGWQLTGAGLVPGQIVRARGYVSGGASGTSSWFVESQLVVAQAPPILLTGGVTTSPNAGFSFHVSGPPDRWAVVEASTNLTEWSPISTNLLGTQPLYFDDPTPGRSPVRFFRARVQ